MLSQLLLERLKGALRPLSWRLVERPDDLQEVLPRQPLDGVAQQIGCPLNVRASVIFDLQHHRVQSPDLRHVGLPSRRVRQLERASRVCQRSALIEILHRLQLDPQVRSKDGLDELLPQRWVYCLGS